MVLSGPDEISAAWLRRRTSRWQDWPERQLAKRKHDLGVTVSVVIPARNEERTVASVVTGIGVICGVECVIIAHDPTVRGGAMNPYSLRKTLRALEIARLNRLPVMNLVESGGADLPTQADLFVPAGRIFHELTELSGLGLPPDTLNTVLRDNAERILGLA